jgi:hypothetical protein
MQGGPPHAPPAAPRGAGLTARGLAKSVGAVLLWISADRLILLDFFQPVTKEGSKFHILPLLYLYSYLTSPPVNLYCLCSLQKSSLKWTNYQVRRTGFFKNQV